MPVDSITPPSFHHDYRSLTSVNALGCLFDIRNVRLLNDGIHIWLVVINTTTEERSVAFYDDRSFRQMDQINNSL
jgi:hypothetical protein